MKKLTILILLLVITACSANSEVEENHAAESEAVEAPLVEPVIEAEVPAPKVELEQEVIEAEKVESEKVEKVEKVEKAEKVDVEKVEKVEKVEEAEKVEQPAVAEPAPVAATPQIHKVKIVNFEFSPTSLEIGVGDIVEFTNLDAVKHSAVADDDVFDTGLLAKDESKQITFSEAGEFGYYCGPHPDMRAAIIVK